jgi:flagellar motor switch protein FliN/FliY
MPDDVKPEASSEEELQPDGNDAVENSVVDVPEEAGEPVAEKEIDAGAEAESVGESEAEAEPEAEVEAGSEEDKEFKPVVNEDDAEEGDAEAAMLAMLEEEGKKVEAEVSAVKSLDEFPDLSGVKIEEPVANEAEFQQLSPSRDSSGTKNNIDMLLDVKMPVSIELGRTEMPISELLSLGPGSVVELNKLAGEPVDLLVNNRVIARGEVVVVDENFGVRITLLLSPEERLKSLAES